MKGLIIVGSAQVGSHTNALAKYLKGQLGAHQVDVVFLIWLKRLFIS